MVGALHRMQSPEKVKETAHEVMKGITKLIEGDGGSGGGGSDGEGGGDGGGGDRTRMRRVRSGGGQRMPDSEEIGEAEGSSFTKAEHPVTVTSSLPVGLGNRMKHKHDTPRGKQSNKSSETASTDPPSPAHPGPIQAGSHNKKASRPPTGWLKKFSREKTAATTATSSAGGSIYGGHDTRANAGATAIGSSAVDSTSSVAVSSGHATSKFSSALTTDLSRTPSILSTSSTISTFPPSTLPSRNPSFAYDGGGESSPHSIESMEIGDSIENLLALQSGRMNYSYFIPIRTKDTTSSSDEDSVRGYKHNRRKRSSGTTTDATAHSTQQSKGRSSLVVALYKSLSLNLSHYSPSCSPFTVPSSPCYDLVHSLSFSFLAFHSPQMKMTIVTHPMIRTFFKVVVGGEREEGTIEGATQMEGAARPVLQFADTRASASLL